MKTIKYFNTSIIFAAVLLLSQSCGKEYLEPKPLSFFAPENTYVDENGFYSAIGNCEHLMRDYYCGTHTALAHQLRVSDLGALGNKDVAGGMTDLDLYMIPTLTAANETNRIGFFWESAYEAIKTANIVIKRIDNVADNMTPAQAAAIKGQGYFHRAWAFYNLVHEFGDVPWIGEELQNPKTDFYTTDRWSILEQLEKDMKFAYENLPEKEPRGRVNKWGAGILYMKILIENQKYDDAIKVGNEIVTACPILTSKLNSSSKNLQLDLHSYEAKLNPKNTEGLFYVVAVVGVDDDKKRIQTMREYGGNWQSKKTPEGNTGTNAVCAAGLEGTIYDNARMVGKCHAMTRPSNYYQYEIWTDMEKADERGKFNKDSWRAMEDMYYNIESAGRYFKQHLVMPVVTSFVDTVGWFAWPHYKIWVPDPDVTTHDVRGGETPWYVYRSAEAYLLMAEACYWKGDLSGEVNYLNVLRNRAGATPYTSVKGIYEILAERARELYLEEFRHDELCRIAYIYAKTGKQCEEFNTVYSLDKFSGNGGANENLKTGGYNFFFDWVNRHHGIFNSGTELGTRGAFRISVHHVLWPVPESSIVANTNGLINQNLGYEAPFGRKTPKKIGE